MRKYMMQIAKSNKIENIITLSILLFLLFNTNSIKAQINKQIYEDALNIFIKDSMNVGYYKIDEQLNGLIVCMDERDLDMPKKINNFDLIHVEKCNLLNYIKSKKKGRLVLVVSVPQINDSLSEFEVSISPYSVVYNKSGLTWKIFTGTLFPLKSKNHFVYSHNIKTNRWELEK